MASAYWQKRNARAIAAGYRNYYDYRAHDNGKLPPSAPSLRGEMLARSRGHRGYADFRRQVSGGRVSMAQVYQSERDEKTGKMRTVSLLVTDKRGNQRIYTIRVEQLDDTELVELEAELEAQGVDVREYTRKVNLPSMFDDEEPEPDEDLDELDEPADDEDEFPF